MEEWRDIPKYEGFYQASNLGRVRSVDRQVVHSVKGMANRKGKALSQKTSKHGYNGVTLNKKGNRKDFNVHRLIAITFIMNPDNKPHVNHLDGNKSNNNIDNLEWCTQSENVIHAYKRKLITSEARRGERSNFALLTEEDVIMIRKIYAKGFSTHKQIAQIFGMADETIRIIINKTSWKHVRDTA